MISLRPARRAFVAAASAAMLIAAAAAQPPAPPQPVDPNDLLRTYPFDRITLPDDSVVLAEPVSPRPLPPLEDPKAKARTKPGSIPLGGNVGLPGEPNKFQPFEPNKAEAPGPDTQILIHLAQDAATGRGDLRDFILKRVHIKKIEYFEDILLAEGERLTKARQYSKAFEHYLRVRQRDPKWPGLDEHVDDLLFAEGKQALGDQDVSRGLRLLRELHARNPGYPGLVDQIATAYAGRIDRAIGLSLFPEARRLLHELEGISADVRQAREVRERLEAMATARASRIGDGSTAERLDAQVEALRIWPTQPALEAEYVKTFAAEPTLDVAVPDIPSPPGPWIHSAADARTSPLLFLPVLADESEEARRGERPGQLAESLEATDLGRRLVVRVRAGVRWSDGSRDVTAMDVARNLIDRCDPRNAATYQARWAELLERVHPLDERQVELTLRRPLLKPSFWLDAPIGAAHAGPDGRVTVSAGDRRLIGTGPFACARADGWSIDLRSSADANAGRVRRIREFRYDRPSEALAAFRRGDVSLLAHVPPDQVAGLRAAGDARVGTYNQPALHVLALDGRSPLLRNRTLRRALSYAVDRKGLLEETILRGPASEPDSPADGVFPRSGSADAPGVRPLGHNPVLAVALASLAKGELKADAIRLKLEFPAIAEVEAVVPRLVEAFRSARIEVEPVSVPPARLEAELRTGRRFDMAYRVLRCDEPVLDAGPMICPGYDAPPTANALESSASPRILQLLLQLERSVDWPTARGLALQIDRESRDELPVLPLWQADSHFAWRDRLKGPTAVAEHVYQDIAQWEIEPWIGKDR